MSNLTVYKRLLLAIISGALIVPISYLESFGQYSIAGASIIDILIGATFSLLVMAPFQKRLNWFRTLLMILASIIIYIGVAHLAVERYHPLSLDLSYTIGITVSGVMGAILTGIAVQILAPVKLTLNSYLALTISGLIAGYIFSKTIDSENIFINAIGFIIWQVSVTLSLHLIKR